MLVIVPAATFYTEVEGDDVIKRKRRCLARLRAARSFTLDQTPPEVGPGWSVYTI